MTEGAMLGTILFFGCVLIMFIGIIGEIITGGIRNETEERQTRRDRCMDGGHCRDRGKGGAGMKNHDRPDAEDGGEARHKNHNNRRGNHV